MGQPSDCSYNPSSITPYEYFDETFDLGDRDVGRPKEVSTKSQKFKVNVFLSGVFVCLHY